MSIFYPNRLVPRVTDIDPRQLAESGVRGLLLDADNTLTTHNSQQLDPAVRTWLDEVAACGIRAVIISNNNFERTKPFAQLTGLPFVSKAHKPLPSGFRRARRALGLTRQQCAVIGDQVFTDVLGARLSRLYCIQVLPIQEEKGHPFLAFKRIFEKRILRRYRRRKENVK